MITEFLDSSGKWQCTQCGDCCRLVEIVLPQLAKIDGSCINLVDNKCAIYDDRPKQCMQKRISGDDLKVAQACNSIRNFIGGRNAVN